MRQDEILAFQRRLSQCNKSEMIVIIYDIYFVYSKEAELSWKKKEYEAFRESSLRAIDVINELLHALDHKYELSGNLYTIYQYSKRKIYQGIAERKIERIQEINGLLSSLRDAFAQIARDDSSEPIMKNAQSVYAGYTYGKKSINENLDLQSQRGFLV